MSESSFSGCLLGGLLGDVIGAVVEGESPKYIRKAYPDLDAMLARERIPEVLGQFWVVGRYTDDTHMTIAVAEWLLDSPQLDGGDLMDRFAQGYHPGRRYGSGAAQVLQAYAERGGDWRDYATLMFPEGSFGNGAAMRVAPIGCLYAHDPARLIQAARISARTTHAHRLARQGAVLQAAAVATALQQTPAEAFLTQMQRWLSRLIREEWIDEYLQALKTVEQALREDWPEARAGEVLGNGVAALESVPLALYCFLRHPDSFENVLRSAIYMGGDADTVAAMAGSISGARLGVQALPRRWLARVREDEYPPARILQLARALSEAAASLAS